MIQTTWEEYSLNNQQHSNNPVLFWETGKAVLRGKIIAFTAAHNKHVLQNYQTHSALLRTAQSTLNQQHTPQNLAMWQEAKKNFDHWATLVERRKYSQSQLHFFKHGNKAGKLLARLSKGMYKPTTIAALKHSTGRLVMTQPEIIAILQDYYTTLYTKVPIEAIKAEQWLNSIDLPQLDDGNLSHLNAPITLEELQHAISSSASGKAPGPDGYSSEFFKINAEILTPSLLLLYNHVWQGGDYPPTGHHAHIKLIHKAGKDPSDPASYRPISLLNVDAKILSKIIASRLANFMPSLINPAQAGFTKGRAASTNIRKVIAALVHAQQNPQDDIAIIALDAEKAFDNVSFQWLHMVLERFGLSGNFLKFIHNLYSSPQARIVAAGTTSDPISLSRGTRQGCPLSPLLFNLALEPLARFLDTEATIHGIHIQQEYLRLALFADDILIFTSSPATDIPKIQEIFSLYNSFSGLKINFHKSEIMPLTNLPHRQWTHNSPFLINSQHITYLGIKVGRLPSSIYQLNFPPIISKIIRELREWTNLPLSLMGRCALFKMVSFARLLYPLQTIPLLLKHKDINALHAAISAFLWRNGKPRIALSKLTLPKTEGGTNFPSIRNYNLACLTRLGLDWILQKSRYTNHNLENALVSPYDLSAVLHTPLKLLPPAIKGNLLFRDTIVAWREVRKKLGLSPHISRYLPIRGNPMLPLSLQYEPYAKWKDKGLIHVCSLYDLPTGNLKSFSSLTLEFGVQRQQFLYVAQIADMVRSKCPTRLTRFADSFLDKLLSHHKYSISDVYHPLNALLTPPLKYTSFKHWLQDLPSDASLDDLIAGYNATRQSIQVETWRETQLNILHRTYCPYSAKFPPQRKASCPWCGLLKPTLIHRLWSCPHIIIFWTGVIKFIRNVTGFILDQHPVPLLFGHIKIASATSNTQLLALRENKRWILLALLCARRTIMAHWISATPPSSSELVPSLRSLLSLEHLDSLTQNICPDLKLLGRWASFIEKCLTHPEKTALSSPRLFYTQAYSVTPP